MAFRSNPGGFGPRHDELLVVWAKNIHLVQSIGRRSRGVQFTSHTRPNRQGLQAAVTDDLKSGGISSSLPHGCEPPGRGSPDLSQCRSVYVPFQEKRKTKVSLLHIFEELVGTYSSTNFSDVREGIFCLIATKTFLHILTRSTRSSRLLLFVGWDQVYQD